MVCYSGSLNIEKKKKKKGKKKPQTLSLSSLHSVLLDRNLFENLDQPELF